MATVVNKAAPDGDPAFTDFFTLLQANTPDFPAAQWVRNSPNLVLLIGTGTVNNPQVPRRYWIVDPPASQNLREMTPTEQAAADTDPTDLLTAQTGQKAGFENQTLGYLAGAYTAELQTQFVILAAGAVGPRALLLGSWVSWVETVLDEMATQMNAVDAATTILAVQATSLDLSPFDGTNPNITLQQVMNA